MLRLSDENMATNPQCYKDREELSMSFMSMVDGALLLLEI